VAVAFNIATDHCYQDRINKDNPFFVFVTYSDESEINYDIMEDIIKLEQNEDTK
jgi:hypothetical protein